MVNNVLWKIIVPYTKVLKLKIGKGLYLCSAITAVLNKYYCETDKPFYPVVIFGVFWNAVQQTLRANL
jgi:hypothetical protein